MTEFTPLAFLRTRSYPAYQFAAVLRYDGRTPVECMHYTILTIMEWIRRKLGTDQLPQELITPRNSEYMSVQSEQLVSYHFHEGINLDITSLLSEGMWALHIKEPDRETLQRKAVIGRFFITDVALRCETDFVRLAVKIDVLDPLKDTDEIDYAYRPAFLRDLFSNKKLRITQSDLLRYDESYSVNNSHGLRHMLDVLKSSDNYMPSIIFTYADEKRKVTDLVDVLDDALSLSGTDASFRNHLATCSLVPDMLEFTQQVLPYDAEYVARHCFGYGRVYVIEPNQFSAFQYHMGSDVHRGDIVWAEPVPFGSETRIIPYQPEKMPAAREYIVKDLLNQVHCFSKHKQYDFSAFLFEEGLRRRETEIRIHSIISELKSSNQKESEELLVETEKLLELYDQEKKQMQDDMEKLLQKNRELQGKLMYLDSRLGKEEQHSLLTAPELKEFYPDEQHDLLVSVLKSALHTYTHEDTRSHELIQKILEANELTGEGKELFQKIKNVLYRSNHLTESDEQDLRKLGFTVSKRSNGHYKLVFQDDERYSFTLAGTSSDSHAMKNAYAEIDGKLSVYK